MFKILMASQNLWSVKSHVECKIRSYVENHSIKIRYSKGTLAPLLKTLQLVRNWYVIVIYSDYLSKFPLVSLKN